MFLIATAFPLFNLNPPPVVMVHDKSHKKDRRNPYLCPCERNVVDRTLDICVCHLTADMTTGNVTYFSDLKTIYGLVNQFTL